MKKIVLIFLLIFITACSQQENDSLLDNINSLLNNVETIATSYPNNTLEYFAYYLPSDMKENEFDQNNLVLNYLDNEIIVNLNINDIINQEYYPNQYLNDVSSFDENKLIYSKEGTYKTIKKDEKNYIYKLYKSDDVYLIKLVSTDLIYLVRCKTNIEEITRHLFTIAKSININSELIIDDYSDKNVIDYKKKQIDLFDITKPVNGNLEELLITDAVVGNETDDKK